MEKDKFPYKIAFIKKRKGELMYYKPNIDLTTSPNDNEVFDVYCRIHNLIANDTIPKETAEQLDLIKQKLYNIIDWNKYSL